MQRRHLSAILTAVTGLTLAGVLATPAQAAGTHSPASKASASDDHGSGGGRGPGGDDRKGGKFRTDGTVSAVDTTAGTVTITHPGRDGTTQTETISVAADAKVSLDGQASSLAALPVGARVRLEGTATATTQTVTRVEARTARAPGDRQPPAGNAVSSKG